jgi:hypothetical protein
MNESVMAAPRIAETKGAVHPHVTGQASAPSPPEATRKIRLILQEGTIDFSAHCWLKRMLERNVSTLDVEHVLGQGRVIREAEWDSDRCNWKYPAGTRTGMINCARRDEYK